MRQKLINGPYNGVELVHDNTSIFPFAGLLEDAHTPENSKQLVGKIRYNTPVITVMVRLRAESNEYSLYELSTGQFRSTHKIKF